jgi:hypothetical protein
MSYLMSMGKPAADVALLLPDESLWMSDAKADDTFVSAERMLSEHQIDFDIVDDDAIASVLKTEKGAFVSMSGNRYRTVLVPRADLLPAAVVERLRAFALAGGRVVFLGKAPALVGGKNDVEAKAVGSDAFKWATTVLEELAPTPTTPQFPPKSAPEPLVVPAAMLSALRSAVPSPALLLATPNTALRYTHRELKDATVFLLFNESAQPLNSEVSLRAAGHSVEVWDPQTGVVKAAEGVKRGSGKEPFKLRVALAPYATQVWVVR